MRTRNIRRTVSLWIIGIIAIVGLTGCFKADVSIDVMPNGSGNLSFAFGMTQQAKTFFSTNQNTDPLQEINKNLGNGIGASPDVKLTSWIDGDYSWTKAEKKFADPEEVNKILGGDKKLFNRFSLTRSHGLLRDEISLDAEFAPLDDGSIKDLKLDPSAIIQMTFSARLPGKIIETNGLRDINDPNRVVWTMASKQPVSIHARSGAWNWPVIFALSGFLLFLGVVAVGGGGYFVYRWSRKNKVLKASDPVIAASIPSIDFTELGIDKLFSQLNEKVLENMGKLETGPGTIALIWKNSLNQEKRIDIKAVADNRISINGQVHPATKKETQEGIVDAFRIQVKK